MASVGSPRMVEIVGELPGKNGPVRVMISREFREWLLAMWRRTGGDGDMVDDVTTTAVSAAAALAGLSAQVAALQERVASLEAEKSVRWRPQTPAGDIVVMAPRV